MKRWIPFVTIVILMIVAYLFEIHRYFTYDSLRDHRKLLTHTVKMYPLFAPVIYILTYALSTALSIPGGAILSIFGGFLFPQPFSTLYVVTGATIGATIIFLIAKTALGKFLKPQAESKLQKMRKGFQQNAANYLLFLRLAPVFPFWMVNLAPAFFGVRLSTFIWTTFVGIIPGAFVYTQAGVGLGAILDSGKALSINEIFNTQVKIALIALGIFALLPIVIKKFRGGSIES